jgi:hypothetical protein
MKKVLLIAGLLMLIGIALFSGDQAKPEALKGKITEFSATDMPFDDGGGVVLKWKPLHKSHRIISYNIYRGVSPDSLFMINSVEVDPKLGVMAPELFFYDRGDQPIIEFETSPASLKKEKQQDAKSPLYRRFPLDAKLLGSLIGRYNLLAAVKNNKLYFKSKEIKKGEEILAGLKLHHFEYILAFPIAGQSYYYTVVPINEKGKFLPHADIQKVIPIDNEPDTNAFLYSTLVRDKGVVNFEWTPPVASPDIAVWEGWLAPKSLVSQNGTLPANWENSSMRLFEMPNLNNPVTHYQIVDTKADNITLPSDPENWTTVLAYSDYQGLRAATPAKQHRIINSAALPIKPEFTIEDKQNDKGDNLVVSIGRPIAYLASASFTNNTKKTIRLNYELAENKHFKVEKLLFTLKAKDGRIITQATEHFLDKVIKIKLPDKYNSLKEFDLRIALETKGNSKFDAYYTEQHVVYDDNNKLFKGKEIFYRGEPISKQFYEVLTKNHFDPDFLFGNRTNGITRAYEHSVPYEDILYQNILGYDAKSKRLTLDPQITIDVDEKAGSRFTVPLFKDVFANQLRKQQTELKDLQARQNQFPAGLIPDSLSAMISQLQGELDYITKNPTYKQAANAKNNKQWLKTLLKTRYQNTRSYSYRLLKTDGKGAMVMSETYKEKNGNSTFTPVSDWFDNTQYTTLVATILMTLILIYTIFVFRRREAYIRPIAGLQEIDNAVGRATEMGRPIMFVPGWGTLGDPSTVASMMILAQVAKKAAEFDIRLISPHCDYLVLPMAQELVQTSYNEVGRPDAYNQNDIFFISYDQFPFCAGVNGITVRDRVATVFYMGTFNAEALLLTETGNQAGSIQIAGTDSTTQVPFFITTCDYTLIGEEFYAASAYLSQNHELICMLKTQDYFKLILVIVILAGTLLSSLHMNSFIELFPVE